MDVTGNSTYSTTNTTFVAKAAGSWRWQVSYGGDANNQGSTSQCGVEHFTIDNGTFWPGTSDVMGPVPWAGPIGVWGPVVAG